MRRRGYTLIELMVVVIIMGIAAAVLTPLVSQANPLRLQALARQVVADVMQVQSDAIAMQRSYCITFSTSGYVIAPVTGSTVETGPDVVVTRTIGAGGDKDFSNVTVSAITFPGNRLTFDAMGCPVNGPGSDEPAGDAFYEITAGTERFRVWVRGFTGAVEVLSSPVN